MFIDNIEAYEVLFREKADWDQVNAVRKHRLAVSEQRPVWYGEIHADVALDASIVDKFDGLDDTMNPEGSMEYEIQNGLS